MNLLFCFAPVCEKHDKPQSEACLNENFGKKRKVLLGAKIIEFARMSDGLANQRSNESAKTVFG